MDSSDKAIVHCLNGVINDLIHLTNIIKNSERDALNAEKLDPKDKTIIMEIAKRYFMIRSLLYVKIHLKSLLCGLNDRLEDYIEIWESILNAVEYDCECIGCSK